MSNSPRLYGIPHDEWRPHQLETLRWIERHHGENKTLIIDAPTGSGKTATAAGLGRNGVVRSLTNTRHLQKQYQWYGFEHLFGMANYPCALMPMFAADMCSFTRNMYDCSAAKACEYLLKRELVSSSRRQSLSYQYYLSAEWPHNKPADYLYCDEAHDWANIVREASTLELTRHICQRELRVPQFPEPKLPSPTVYKRQITEWILTCIQKLEQDMDKIAEQVKLDQNPKVIRRSIMIRRNLDKMRAAYTGLTTVPDAYIVELDNYDYTTRGGQARRGEMLRIVPMTARFDSPRLLHTDEITTKVMTSATIGDPETFAKSLGLEDYEYMQVPSQFGPDQMPVYIPDGVPKMRASSPESTVNKQADMMAGMIKDCPPSWNGIIHFASKRATHDMARRLSRRGLQDRVYVTEGDGTDGKIKKWWEAKQKRPNLIALSYSFWEGLDAFDSQFCFVAKVPYATLDKVGRQVMDYDKKVYRLNAAIKVQQGCGRIRRGEMDRDYESPGEPMKKLVAVFDWNVNTVKNLMSPYFRKCFKKL